VPAHPTTEVALDARIAWPMMADHRSAR